MKTRQALLGAFCIHSLFLVLSAGSARADQVLYSDPPSAYGLANLYTADIPLVSGESGADSFTLTSPSVLTGIDFTAVTTGGGTPTSVDWAITSSNFSGTTFSSGTASGAGLADTFVTTAGASSVYSEEFALPAVQLSGPGTYYLDLSDALSSTGGSVGWNNDYGASAGFEKDIYSPPGGFDELGEEFSVIGTPATVPEASTFAGLLIGSFGLVGFTCLRSLARRSSRA